MATTTLNTRIALKIDTTENWASSTLVLLKGETAYEITTSGDIKMKVGDGVNTFANLGYTTMTPAEINSLVSSGAIQSVSIASGTNNGTIKLTVDGKTTDNIAVKGLGSAAYTATSAYATAAQGTLATNAVRKVATGSANGTISVTTGTGAATDVAVKGLGSAAYTASSAYAAASHTHTIANVTGLQTALDGKSATTHTHDDRYYTETEMNTKLAGKANSSHTHGSNDITSLDAAKLTGKISIERLPAGALERCVIVETDEKRLALTTSDVQKGDTVKVAGTGKMYFVIDDTKLNSEDGYTVYTAGSATSVPWSGVTGKPSTYTPSAHTHTKSEVGLGNVDNTADANKSVKYATSAGTATNVSSQGSASANEGRHIWFSASTETSRAHNDAFKYNPSTNTVTANITGNAASASSVAWGNVTGKPSTYAPSSHTHTIANVTNLQSELNNRALSKALEANADLNSCITPGIYSVAGGNTITNKPSGVDSFGLIVTHNASGPYYTQILYGSDSAVPYRRCCKNGNWSGWTRDVLIDTWRGIQNNLTSDSTTDSLSAAQGKALKALVDGKAAASHTHSQYYDSNVSRDANTVLAAPNGSAGKATFRKLVAADIPTLTKSKISDFPAALKNPNSLAIKLNGGTTEGTNLFTYDGSGAKTINITPAAIGASASGHTHNYAGSGSAGGAANSAVKLSTARSFSITGGAVAAAVSFNGSANVALSVSSLNTDYLVNGSNTLVLACGGA